MFFFSSAIDTRTPLAVQLWHSSEDSAFASASEVRDCGKLIQSLKEQGI